MPRKTGQRGAALEQKMESPEAGRAKHSPGLFGVQQRCLRCAQKPRATADINQPELTMTHKLPKAKQEAFVIACALDSIIGGGHLSGYSC